MRVFVNNKRNNTGTISVEYKAVDQLDRLVEVIKKKLLIITHKIRYKI